MAYKGSGEPQQIKIRSYEKVWKIEHRIYAVGTYVLPVPVSLTAIGYFIIGLIVSLILSKFTFLSHVPAAFKFILIPYGIMYWLRNVTLDGKNPIKFFGCYIKFYIVERGNYSRKFKLHSLKEAKTQKNRWTVRTRQYIKPKPISINWQCITRKERKSSI